MSHTVHTPLKRRVLPTGTLLVAVALVGCKVNHPPAIPEQPWAPDTLWVGELCARIYAEAEDPDGDDVCLRFQWGDGEVSPWSDWVESGYGVWGQHRWSCCGDFNIRAQAMDVQ